MLYVENVDRDVLMYQYVLCDGCKSGMSNGDHKMFEIRNGV